MALVLKLKQGGMTMVAFFVVSVFGIGLRDRATVPFEPARDVPPRRGPRRGALA